MTDRYKQQYSTGTQYMSRGKRKDICTVTDFLTVTNSKGEIVKTYYQYEHDCMGQTVTEHEVCAVTVARGIWRLDAMGESNEI